jgi:GTP cyclohydrolase II
MAPHRKNQATDRGLRDHREQLAVARAIDDLRRGLPVRLRHGDNVGLVCAIETVGQASFSALFQGAGAAARILISANRARTLNIPDKGRQAVVLTFDQNFGIDDLRALADPTEDLGRPLSGPYRRIEYEETKFDSAALQLCKLARLLPAAIVAVSENGSDSADLAESLLEVSTAAVEAFPEDEAASLREVARATIPLEGAEDTRIVIFRPELGGPEHLALLIGKFKPHDAVLTRVHSACLTGDILGSLKCDCGQQLQGAIKTISEAGGGVLVYLAQEGRGIGLAAKIKAYFLQDQGFDTHEANLRLGFEADERLFAPAAQILEQLGVGNVRLLTNNPEKVKALKALGIKVSEMVGHVFPPNPHNEDYLRTKREKAGHRV